MTASSTGGPTPTPGATPTPTPSPTATPSATPGATRIRDIQGAAHLSPLATQTVANVPGIVTAKTSNGFYLQDPSPDANDATSEGIFVFTSSLPTVNVGDSVLVGGTVAEFRPGGSSSTNLTTTEISGPECFRAISRQSVAAADCHWDGRAYPADDRDRRRRDRQRRDQRDLRPRHGRH